MATKIQRVLQEALFDNLKNHKDIRHLGTRHHPQRKKTRKLGKFQIENVPETDKNPLSTRGQDTRKFEGRKNKIQIFLNDEQ